MPLIQIAITMDDNGKVDVAASGGNKVQCYGLLAIAKEVIAASFAEQQRLVQPVMGDVARALARQ